jgi:hypothetical protein
MQIRIVPESNPSTKIKWVANGDFFCAPESDGYMRNVLEAIKGNAMRDGGPFQVRLIWSYTTGGAGYMVRGDSDIQTIYDIKPGHKFVFFEFVPGFQIFVDALCAWIGIDPDDLIMAPCGNYATGIRFISMGQADISFAYPMSPDVFEAASAPNGIRWLELLAVEDPEGAKRFQELISTATFGKMASGAGDAIGKYGLINSSYTMTRVESDPDMVYHFAKWMDENFELYKDNHPWNKNMNIDGLMHIINTSFTPVHDGLIKYLQEKGLWTAAHDARQKQNVELLTRYVEAYQVAIDMADDKAISVDPENEEWIELWEGYKQELNLPKFKPFVSIED